MGAKGKMSVSVPQSRPPTPTKGYQHKGADGPVDSNVEAGKVRRMDAMDVPRKK